MKIETRRFEIARSLFREANDAFFLFDPQNRVVDLNPAALRLTGLDIA
jgi:PAS domain S-box-containing protein